MRPFYLALALLLAFSWISCGGSPGSDSSPSTMSAAVSPATLVLSQDGTPADITITVNRSTTNALVITTTGLPSGISTSASGLSSNSPVATLAVATVAQAKAGNYTVTFHISDGTGSASASLPITIAVAAQVGTVSSQHSRMFLSTSFQPADWNYQYFQTNTVERQNTLDQLGPRHINLQPMDGATDSLRPGLYDFSKMDAIVQPVLQVTDGSPLLQLYAPTWMWINGDPSKGLIDPTFNQFADFAATLVKYYNVSGGFTDSITGKNFASPAGKPIQWWGVFNEPNLTSLTPQQYVALYNLTAQKMLAVDPNIKLVAVELSDWGNEPQRYLPAFVQGVTQPVHALATHYYGSCNQKDTDNQLISTVPGFRSHVEYFYSQMKTKPSLANLPVWVTENNVNADWSNNGVSNCNPPQPFVADSRGSSAFFAGWRPYVFSQLLKGGAESLHHWDYNADQQYGEVDSNTGKTLLSYWADLWLGQMMTDVDDPTQSGVDVLPVVPSEFSPEILAVRKSDGTVSVMVANFAVANAGDNNGAGTPRTVMIDTSTIGTFKSVSQVTLDATTSSTTGPTAATITPAAKIPVTLNGYGVSFLKFVP